MPEEELSDTDKLALDYSWNWFDFHGKQRMQLFNYFLIITGILATAYASALDKNLYGVEIAVCVLGIIQSVAFIVFDISSRHLTRRAEYALHALEHSKQLFKNYQYKESNIEICRPLGKAPPKWITMQLWIWILEGTISILFTVAAIYSVYRIINRS